MPGGDIAINLVGQNSLSPAIGQSIQSLNALNMAIDRHISRAVGQTKAQLAFNQMLSETAREQSRGVQITGKQQMAINQLIFAVDDATTSYGTGGLAGAIRGAANNLTMAASVMGPWGAAVAVGVSAVTQLGLAFMKTGEETKTSTSALDEFQQKLDEIDRIANRIRNVQATPDVNSMTANEAASRIAEIDQQQAKIERERQFLQERQKEMEQGATAFAMTKTGAHNAKSWDELLEQLPSDARSEYDRRLKEIDRLKQRQADLRLEGSDLSADRFALSRGLPHLRQLEQGRLRDQQTGEALQRDRERIAGDEAARESGRVMAEGLQSELLKGSRNPELRRQGAELDIKSGYQRRVDEINGMGNLDPGLRQQMLQNAESIAAGQLTDLRMKDSGLSAKGPQALKSGELDTERFLNQARLGAAGKSAEEKQLIELNKSSRELLTAYRNSVKGQRDQPVTVVDF